jgi:hypothetical protein
VLREQDWFAAKLLRERGIALEMAREQIGSNPPEKVDKIVEILGQGFSGTTAVSFNGTPAAFNVISDTFLKATVPQGATTGPVTVTTPSGPLTSNVPYRVRPTILSFSPSSGPVET